LLFFCEFFCFSFCLVFSVFGSVSSESFFFLSHLFGSLFRQLIFVLFVLESITIKPLGRRRCFGEAPVVSIFFFEATLPPPFSDHCLLVPFPLQFFYTSRISSRMTQCSSAHKPIALTDAPTANSLFLILALKVLPDFSDPSLP